MKTNRLTLLSLAKRIAELEARLVALEQRPAAPVAASHGGQAAEDIPWAVITAAVAAVVSHEFLIRSVCIVLPEPRINWWGLEGRTDIFQSHRIR